MDSPGSNELIHIDISEVYMRYCDIISRSNYGFGRQDHRQDGELGRAEFSREALGQLLKSVESGMLKRISVFDELVKLMLKLDFMVDFSEFSRFYDFVFFICRENGQKNITVSRAITGWKLVLAGRFRLLNQWCDFVEKNQRYNISEDTWRQVLAFSRCVHENLEGYDSEGAWPILIDDFVEHMYRISGSGRNFVFCNCSDSEDKSCIFDAPRPGLKIYPGSKRKLLQDSQMDVDAPGNLLPGIVGSNTIYKRNRPVSYADSTGKGEENCPEHSIDNYTESVKHNSPRGSSKSPCAVEGCLSKGFASLFSNGSRLSYT